MSESVAKALRRVERQREEILEAFVAKYGFQPDECQQIEQGNSWCVVRLAPEQALAYQNAVLLSRLNQKKFTRWQGFCMWLGGMNK